jgi:signal transduction histidine kinase
MRRLLPRPTMRARLVAGACGLILVTGAGLLAVNYALTARALHDSTAALRARVEGQLGLRPGLLLPASRRELQAPPHRGQDHVVARIPSPRRDAALTRAPRWNERIIPVATILDAYEEELRSDALNDLLVRSGLVLGLVAVASMSLAVLLARGFLRPVRRMTHRARHISEDNPNERLRLSGPDDEFKELADTFDGLLDRLNDAFTSQSRFVANASHELRTPLAVIRTHTDLVEDSHDPAELRAALATVRDVSLRNEDLLERLLMLTRSQGPLLNEPCDLAEIAADALDRVGHEIRDHRLAVQRELECSYVEGDRLLLEQMIGNLVDNGVRHNVDGGWLRVIVRTDDAVVRVRISNSGPVVPARAVAELFEPFRRLTDERTTTKGWGLGLSIARAVAEAHAGTVRAVARDEGGLSLEVTLPSSWRAHAPGTPGADQQVRWRATAAPSGSELKRSIADSVVRTSTSTPLPRSASSAAGSGRMRP